MFRYSPIFKTSQKKKKNNQTIYKGHYIEIIYLKRTLHFDYLIVKQLKTDYTAVSLS